MSVKHAREAIARLTEGAVVGHANSAATFTGRTSTGRLTASSTLQGSKLWTS